MNEIELILSSFSKKNLKFNSIYNLLLNLLKSLKKKHFKVKLFYLNIKLCLQKKSEIVWIKVE